MNEVQLKIGIFFFFFHYIPSFLKSYTTFVRGMDRNIRFMNKLFFWLISFKKNKIWSEWIVRKLAWSEWSCLFERYLYIASKLVWTCYDVSENRNKVDIFPLSLSFSISINLRSVNSWKEYAFRWLVSSSRNPS